MEDNYLSVEEDQPDFHFLGPGGGFRGGSVGAGIVAWFNKIHCWCIVSILQFSSPRYAFLHLAFQQDRENQENSSRRFDFFRRKIIHEKMEDLL